VSVLCAALALGALAAGIVALLRALLRLEAGLAREEARARRGAGKDASTDTGRDRAAGGSRAADPEIPLQAFKAVALTMAGGQHPWRSSLASSAAEHSQALGDSAASHASQPWGARSGCFAARSAASESEAGLDEPEAGPDEPEAGRFGLRGHTASSLLGGCAPPAGARGADAAVQADERSSGGLGSDSELSANWSHLVESDYDEVPRPTPSLRTASRERGCRCDAPCVAAPRALQNPLTRPRGPEPVAAPALTRRPARADLRCKDLRVTRGVCARLRWPGAPGPPPGAALGFCAQVVKSCHGVWAQAAASPTGHRRRRGTCWCEYTLAVGAVWSARASGVPNMYSFTPAFARPSDPTPSPLTPPSGAASCKASP
jgi:hypothetical protein